MSDEWANMSDDDHEEIVLVRVDDLEDWLHRLIESVAGLPDDALVDGLEAEDGHTKTAREVRDDARQTLARLAVERRTRTGVFAPDRSPFPGIGGDG